MQIHSRTYQQFLDKAYINLIPLFCVFELTYKCNLRCVHCYLTRCRKEELSTSEVFLILEQLQQAGCLYLIFTGGEIFLRKDFYEIAEYSRHLNFALSLYTNGTLIDADAVLKIKKLLPLRVEISLYGFRDTHDRITQINGSYVKTLEAIKLLRDAGIHVTVKSVVIKQNVSEVFDFKDFIEKEIGVETLWLDAGLLISPRKDCNQQPIRYRVSNNQLKEHIRRQIKYYKVTSKAISVFHKNQNGILCNAGHITCNVTPYGELNPCISIQLKRGNSLRDLSFIEIWKNNPEMNRVRTLRIKDRISCAGCELDSYCTICAGISLLETGSLTAQHPEACRQAKIRKEIYAEFLA